MDDQSVQEQSAYPHAPLNFCRRCDGCKQIADDEEGAAWWHWAMLPPPSNIAVMLGIVQPIPCPVCNGTGRRKQE